MLPSYGNPSPTASDLEGVIQPDNNRTEYNYTHQHLENTKIAQANLESPPPPQPAPEETKPPVVEPPPLPLEPTSEETTVEVKSILVTGSTVFEEAELNPIIQPLEGKTVTLGELRLAADEITQIYLEQGFITSRAVVVEESLVTGNVEIQVIEGIVESIEVEGTQRLNNYVRSRINLGAGTPLNTGKLEDQLRLLRVNPLFENIEASLRAGTGLGQSIVVVRVTEANPLVVNLSVDNYSPPSVGSERLGFGLLYRNLTGTGDEIAAAYYPRTASEGTYDLDFRYRVPLNATNGTLEARSRINRNEVIRGSFESLDIRGESERYELTYRQPLIRTPRQELALSAGFAYQDGQTFTFFGPTPFGIGPDEDGVSRTSVFSFQQEYVYRQVSGAWALRSRFNIGTGLFDATSNSDSIPDGQFFSWLGQVQRVQVLNQDNFLIIQGDLQLTPDPLLASQQFVIGGGQSVRGYRQNVRSGDNGFIFSIEDQITLQRDEAGVPILILAPFFNMGTVWNVDDNPNPLPDQNFIAALGLGLLLKPVNGLSIRLDYAPPLIDLDDRGDNAQDDGFFFSVQYSN